jgi:hypothetical protein
MSRAADALDGALGAWLARQAAAEERLTSFAFREGEPAPELAPPTSHDAMRRWILRTISEPEVAGLLRLLGPDGRPLAELATLGVLGLRPHDRVALAARIGVLAAAGLVARDLERDRVVATPLGLAALEAAAGTGSEPGVAAAGARP